jgi:hypothetical protein
VGGVPGSAMRARAAAGVWDPASAKAEFTIAIEIAIAQRNYDGDCGA